MTHFRMTGQGQTQPSAPGVAAHNAARRLHEDLQNRGRDRAIKLGGDMRRSLNLKKQVYRGDR